MLVDFRLSLKKFYCAKKILLCQNFQMLVDFSINPEKILLSQNSKILLSQKNFIVTKFISKLKMLVDFRQGFKIPKKMQWGKYLLSTKTP